MMAIFFHLNRIFLRNSVKLFLNLIESIIFMAKKNLCYFYNYLIYLYTNFNLYHVISNLFMFSYNFIKYFVPIIYFFIYFNQIFLFFVALNRSRKFYKKIFKINRKIWRIVSIMIRFLFFYYYYKFSSLPEELKSCYSYQNMIYDILFRILSFELLDLFSHLNIGNKILSRRLIYTISHLALIFDYKYNNSMIALDFLLVFYISNQIKDFLFLIKKSEFIHEIYCLFQPFLFFIMFMKYIDQICDYQNMIFPGLIYVHSQYDSYSRMVYR